MINVKEAEEILLDNTRIRPTVQKKLQDSYGDVLQEEIRADRDQPAGHHVQMDGIAIHFATYQDGQRKFPVEDTQKAGDPLKSLHNLNACMEVMTGALLPDGCDCVIPIEDVEMDSGQITIHKGVTPELMQFIRPQGQDYKDGDLLLKKGSVLTPQAIAIAAAVGKNLVKVSAQPKIAVVGTGDELVELDQPVESHQSRRSNVYAIEAILHLNGFSKINLFHIEDDRAKILEALKRILVEFDVIILSGGVSMGKFDFIPAVLDELDVQTLFHKVKQRPGKPLLFGITPERKPVFGLPGNPVSTQICTYRYVLPYLNRNQGMCSPLNEYALLTKEFKPTADLTFFLPVRVQCNAKGQFIATPVAYTGSGHFAALTRADGFVELPAGQKLFDEGYVARLFRW